MARLRAARERQWTTSLLSWQPIPRPRLLDWPAVQATIRADVSVARYFINAGRYETLAWCEPRDLGRSYRVEIGSFSTVRSGGVRGRRSAAAAARAGGGPDRRPDRAAQAAACGLGRALQA